jgi:hypothetical protein
MRRVNNNKVKKSNKKQGIRIFLVLLFLAICIYGGKICVQNLTGVIQSLKENKITEILPIVSDICIQSENRFSTPEKIKEKLETLTGKEIIDTIAKAEPIWT